MPKELERKLRAEARKKGFGKERTDRYVYGTLRKLGYPVGRGAQVRSKMSSTRRKKH